MPSLKTFDWQETLAKQGQKRFLRLLKKVDPEIRKVILEAVKKVEPLIAALPEGTVGASTRAALYAQQRSLLLEAALSVWTDIAQVTHDFMKVSTQAALNANEKVLDVLTKAGIDEAPLLVNSLQRSAATTMEDIRSRFLNDIDLSPQVYRNASYMTGKIDEIVNTGIALGQSAREISDAVLEHINPHVSGGQRYAANRLARTELNNAFHSTSIRSYMESPWVIGVKWHLSGSHPKRDDCNEYAENNHNGLGAGVFLPAEVPAKPHPQCFCYLAPITPSTDQFMKSLLSGKYDCDA